MQFAAEATAKRLQNDRWEDLMVGYYRWKEKTRNAARVEIKRMNVAGEGKWNFVYALLGSHVSWSGDEGGGDRIIVLIKERIKEGKKKRYTYQSGHTICV